MAKSELDKIIHDHEPRLRSFVRSKVDNCDDADDIVQDTFYQLVRTIRVLNNPVGHVASWLYTVAHNLIINHGRKHRPTLPQSIATNEDDVIINELTELMASDDDTPDIVMLRSMVWQQLDKALSELPEEQRKAWVLTEQEGLSAQEAALQTGVTRATLLSRKHYAVLHIRKKMRRLYEELISGR